MLKSVLLLSDLFRTKAVILATETKFILYFSEAFKIFRIVIALDCKSGGELLEMRLLDSHLLDTFGSKSIARHEIDKLLESS